MAALTTPVDEKQCSLLGPVALVVQALMGVMVILSLVYKRHRENPPRPWRIWLFDVSKQVVGQGFVHGLNIFISDVSSHHSTRNACVYYFLNILIDTTLGVLLIFTALRAYTHVLTERIQLKGFQSGQYGDPPSFSFWIRQTAVYLTALTTMKLVVVALFALFPGITLIGEWLLSWTQVGEDADSLQIIFVMGVFPIVMNILQFWLIDSIVKGKPENYEVIPSEGGDVDEDHANEALFDADEGMTSSHGPNDVESQRHSRATSPPNSSIARTLSKGPADSYAYPPNTRSPSSSILMTNTRRKNSSDRTFQSSSAFASQARPASPEEQAAAVSKEWEDTWGEDSDGEDGWSSSKPDPEGESRDVKTHTI